MPVKSLFRLTFMSFWHISFLSFEHSLYSLAQDVSGLSCTFPVPSLESAISPRSHASFQYGQYLEAKVFIRSVLVASGLSLFPGPFLGKRHSWFLFWKSVMIPMNYDTGFSLAFAHPYILSPSLALRTLASNKINMFARLFNPTTYPKQFRSRHTHGTMRTNLWRLPGLLAAPFVPPSN